MLIQIGSLHSLKCELEQTLKCKVCLNNRERFHLLVSAGMRLLHLTDEDVADRLPVSRSTVSRWRRGVATPLPMMRKPVYKFLLRRVNNVTF